MKPALLQTGTLSVGRHDRPLVRAVNMQLRAGSLTALIGVNGCGKSTLLRTLAGLLPPIAGSVHAGTRNVHTMTAAERARHIALVLPGAPPAGQLDVRTLVSFGRHPWTGALGRLSSSDQRLIDGALERTGIAHLAHRPMTALSDGERQQVLIARALVQDTPVVLLDEPTAFLDLVNRVRIMQLLRTIAEGAGKALLLSTHDLRTALDLAHDLALMDDGRLWTGTPEQALAEGRLARAFERFGLRFDPVTGALRPPEKR